MNTLKRTLCLLLCCAMLLSIMDMETAASDFSDSDAIENREAVDTLYALHIIKGKEDGSYYDPTGAVTRAELCKMICVALNGGKEPVLDPVQPSYTDTGGHWANNCIEYCTRLGIVSGRGNGLFDPNAPVTGTEAAKMLLVAIGFNAANERFVGSSWAVSVNIRAAEKELYAGLADLTPSDPLNRDGAAQMVWNTISASMVEYEYQAAAVNGELTTIAAVRDITPVRSILTYYYKAVIRSGVLTGIAGSSLNITADSRPGSVNSSYTNVGNDYSALLGQYVTVYSRADDEVIGVVAAGENRIVPTAFHAISDDSGRVNIGGVSYTLNNGTAGSVTVLLDGVDIGAKTSSYFLDPLSFHDVTFADNNGDGGYEYAVITAHTPAKVNDVSSTELIAGGTAYRYEEHSIVSGLKTGDYVAVTADLFGNCMKINKMEPVTGIINGYRSGTNSEYRIGDTWYLAKGTLSGIALGDTAQLFAVNGVIYYARKADAATLDNVVLVLAADPPTVLNRRAKLLLSDGTAKIVTIDLESDGSAVPVPGELYTCAETNYGYLFKAASTAGDNTYTATPAVAAAGGRVGTVNGIAVLDGAVIFVWDAAGADGKVITGKQLKTLALNTAISAVGISSYTAVVGGLNRIVMAAVAVGTDGVLPVVGNPADSFGLIVEDAYQIGEDLITYKLWDGASIVTVMERNASSLMARTQKSLIRYSAVMDGIIEDVSPAGETKGALIGRIGDEVSFDGTTMYGLTSDTIYMYYDSAADSAADIGRADGTLIRADEIEGVYPENVKYVLDGTDVLFLLIDVNNRLSDATVYPAVLTNSSAASAVFWDAYGKLIPSGTALPAGTFIHVTITAAAACSVEAVFSGAVYSSGSGDVYAGGDDIALRAGEAVILTFVVSGAASIAVRNAG